MKPVSAVAAAPLHKTIKRSIPSDDPKKSRMAVTHQIRKEKRDDRIQQKRMRGCSVPTTAATGTNANVGIMTATDANSLPQQQHTPTTTTKRGIDETAVALSYTISTPSPHRNTARALKKVKTSDPHSTIRDMLDVIQAWTHNPASVSEYTLMEHVKFVRRVSQLEPDPPIAKMVEWGVVPQMERLLHHVQLPETLLHRTPIDLDSCHKLQLEATWLLTNISAGGSSSTGGGGASYTASVAGSNAVYYIVDMLHLDDLPAVREMAAMCLANLAVDEIKYRDALLAMPKFVSGIVNNLTDPHNKPLMMTFSWLVGKVMKLKTVQLPGAIRAHFVPCLTHLVKLGVQCRVPGHELQEMTVALDQLLEHRDECGIIYDMVVESGVAKAWVTMLTQYAEDRVLLQAAVRSLGNLASGKADHTQHVVDVGFLKCAARMRATKSLSINRLTLWALSNIAAGTPSQKSAMLSNPTLCTYFIDLASIGAYKIKCEALWTITNIMTTGTDRDRLNLMSKSSLQPLCSFLSIDQADIGLMIAVLESLGKLLKFNCVDGSDCFGYIEQIVEEGAVDHLHLLESHPNDKINSMASHLVETYLFELEDECGEDENLVPLETTVDGVTTYEFGVQQLPSKQLFPMD